MGGGVDANASVFVNYRREDTQQIAGRFVEELSRLLGSERVFLDEESIRAGERWQERLLAELDRSAIVFVLIGPRWLGSINEESRQRRLDEPGDWVRAEIERALAKPEGVIVPLLVGDVTMPKAEHLPASIARLAKLQARPLRPGPSADWRTDFERVVVELGLRERAPEPPTPTRAASAFDRSITFVVAEGSVRCTLSGGASASGAFELGLEPDKQVGKELDAISRNRCSAEDIRNLGSELWLRLRPGSIEPLVSRALGEVRDAGKGCAEIRLCLPPELEGLPWEAIDSTEECLAVAPGIAVSRLAAGDKRKPFLRPELTGGELRLLTIIPGGSGLQPSIEWQRMQEALRGSRAPVKTCLLDGQVTPDRLADELRSTRWDLVHFIGHGRCAGPERQDFELRLNGAEPRVEDSLPPSDFWMPAATFVNLVAQTQPQVVVLNCCHSAGMDGFGGSIGSALSRRGVPAAVVMRYEIRDDAAAEFSRAFYRELLAGNAPGDVGLAVQEGRAALHRNFPDPQRVRSHVTPVLYLGESCRQLLPALTRLPPPKAPSLLQPAAAAPLNLPEELLDAARAGHLLPILGPGILGADAVRRERPSLDPHTLGGRLARASTFPDFERIQPLADTSAQWLVPLLFQRYCQHFEVTKKPAELARFIREAYHGAVAPSSLELIASWKTAGFVYTYVDGLLEAKLAARPGSNLRVLQPHDLRSGTKPSAASLSLLNLRGHYSSPASMVLTELDEDRLLDAAQPIADYVEALMLANVGTSLLFLGVSPRDPVVRCLARRLLRADNERSRGTAYFVAHGATRADQGYWEKLDGLEWIDAAVDAVIRGVSAAGSRA